MNAIRELEAALDQLLPEFRLEGTPGVPLLSAADQWADAVWAAATACGPYPLENGDFARGLRLAGRPVFICGVHRSGTTLMRDLLDGSPQLSVLPSEGSFLTGLRPKIERLPPDEQRRFLGREWLQRLANPINQAPYWLLGRTTEVSSPYLLYARMLLAWWPAVADHFGADRLLNPLTAVALAYASCSRRLEISSALQRWVEKTPTNEFFLETLWAEFPDAKVLHVIRDPAAVYASRKRLEERALGGFKNRRKALEDLARSLEIAAKNRARSGQGAYLIVRYEELVETTEEVMAGVAAFLGIEPDPVLLRPTVADLPTYANSSFSRHDHPGSVIAPDIRGESLSDAEQELLAAVTGDFADTLGYPLKTLSANRKRVLKMKLHLWGNPR
jgi:hypothetical protein